MKIEIDIPKAFEKHFNQDKFKYSFDNFLREYNSELLRIANQVDISYEYDDVCEWKQDNMCETVYRVCGGFFTTAYQTDFEFCPYCGKKIKIVGD